MQWIFIALLVLVALRFSKNRDAESGFKSGGNPDSKRNRLRRPSPALQPDPETAASKQRARLLLQGVVLTGLPHQILGVREDASEFEIRKAHRDLIKRFHPDKVGQEGSREWYEAQRASEAINGARDAMLARLARLARH